MSILLVASHGPAAVTSISSMIDCGWMVLLISLFVGERGCVRSRGSSLFMP